MREQWDELKETIIELRDNNGTATQQEVCKFLATYMNVLEAQMEPERKKGKWIKMSDADGVYWACSECGEEIPRVDDFDPQFDLFHRLKSMEKTNFCSNCGAEMTEVSDAEVY